MTSDKCKNHKLCIRLSEDDIKAIKPKAELLGLSVGQYMRFISLQADVEITKINVRQKFDKPY